MNDPKSWDTDMITETIEVPKAEDLVKEIISLRAEVDRLRDEVKRLRVGPWLDFEVDAADDENQDPT